MPMKDTFRVRQHWTMSRSSRLSTNIPSRTESRCSHPPRHQRSRWTKPSHIQSQSPRLPLLLLLTKHSCYMTSSRSQSNLARLKKSSDHKRANPSRPLNRIKARRQRKQSRRRQKSNPRLSPPRPIKLAKHKICSRPSKIIPRVARQRSQNLQRPRRNSQRLKAKARKRKQRRAQRNGRRKAASLTTYSSRLERTSSKVTRRSEEGRGERSRKQRASQSIRSIEKASEAIHSLRLRTRHPSLLVYSSLLKLMAWT